MSSSRRSLMATSVANVMYTNAVYFPNHRIYQGDTPGMLNYGCINHIYYAYASIASDGSVFLSDEWADARAPVDGVQGGLGSLMHLKQKHPHLHVILSIGGVKFQDLFPVIASNASSRDNFARSALGLVEASGLDGVDVAWEYPCNAKQGDDFLALLASVRTHLPEDRFILTTALPASKSILQFINLSVAANYLDFINLAAFDFYGTWASKTGHHSQLYAMSKEEDCGSLGVSYLLSQGYPSKRILLGIPAYGRCFVGATGPGQDYTGGDGGSTFEYNQLPRKGCRETVDNRRVAAQCVGTDGGFVTYDNPDTVKTKAGFCKQKELGGLVYWHGPADSKDTSRSLIVAGFRALHTS